MQSLRIERDLFFGREELGLDRIQSQRLSNPREAATMNRQRAESLATRDSAQVSDNLCALRARIRNTSGPTRACARRESSSR